MNTETPRENRYIKEQQTEALKLPAKAIYSNEFRDRLFIRVAVYVRVSTDNIEQATSFDIQQAHYISYIAKQEGWTMTQIYAEEGVTGTNTKHRTQFNRMLDDARTGKFDLIVTKSVSRFARNLLDGIKTTRELLHLPVPVGLLFEEEGLNTFRPDSEFILSVMLMMAQGESEKKSSAVKKAL
jgi:DNA invertase Pin-like site-specific DNA recombinase